jgi:ATP-dependent helicase/DNAse subunit B
MTDNLFSPGRLLITDRVSNINRLIRRGNRYNNEDMVDCHVLSITQVAQELVYAYSALYEPGVNYRFISPAMSAMIMQVILGNTETEYIPKSSKCNKTAAEILRIFDQIRLNYATPEFEQGTEPRLSELRSLMKQYEERLSEKNELDYPALIDKAIACIKDIAAKANIAGNLPFFLPKLNDKAEVSCLFFSELFAKEKEFVSTLETVFESAYGKKFNDITNDGSSTAGENYHFFESYGAANEVRYVAEKIENNKKSFGDVIVIYASDVYENLLRAEFESRGIKYTFPNGIHASSENYIALMLDMIAFVKEDYSYEALDKVIKNPIFNLKGAARSYRKILQEGIGWGKSRYVDFIKRFNERPASEEDLTQDKKERNEELSAFARFLNDLISVFEEKSSEKSCQQIFEGLVKVANSYSYKADACRIAMSQSLKGQARVFSLASNVNDIDGKLQLIIDFLGELRYETGERPDAVMVVPYGSAHITDRKAMFVLGLSNDNIAPTRAESPVFTDEQLRRYAKGHVLDSTMRNALSREAFEKTLSFFEGDDVYLGYSDYDTVGLLDNSPSILYSDLLAKAGKSESDIEKVGYSLIKGAVKVSAKDTYDAYLPAGNKPEDDAETTSADGADKKENSDTMTPAYFSASSIQTLLYCPLQYYYRKIRRIPDIQYVERRPDRWLMPNQKGNLFHHTMEEYATKALIENAKTSKDEALLLEIYERHLEEMKKEQPCPSDVIYEAEKEECYQALLSYAGSLHEHINEPGKGRKVLGCEVEFTEFPYSGGNVYTDETGVSTIDATYDIRLSGSADRVDGYVEDGVLNIEIIDYKTGSSSYKQNEIDEGIQIQHFVYAMAVKAWAKEHIKELEKRFGAPVASCRISSMKYEFPFGDVGENIDVSNAVRDEELVFPDELDQVLAMTIGNIQHERSAAAFDFMEKYAEAKLEEAVEKKIDHCKYCSYAQICRTRI